jgi:uncharacterized protein with GYD domain
MAIPDAPALDLWVDGNIVARNLNYKDVVNYTTINSGDRYYRLVPAGQDSSQAILRERITVRSLTKITTVFAGSKDYPGILDTQERFTYSDETKKLADSASVKFINVNMSAGECDLVDVITGNDKTLISSIGSGTLSGYTLIVSGTHTLRVVTTQNSVEVIPPFEYELKFTADPKQGYRYTFVLVGTGSNAELLKLQDDPS